MVLPTDQVRLVSLSVAIVISSITRLGNGHHGITRSESFQGANSLPRAHTKFVCHFTWCPERQFHGLVGTGALPRIRNTLQRANSIDGGGGLTRETPGAVIVADAGAAAEATGVVVVNTNVLVAGNAFAVVAGGTGSAEIGDVRYADVDEVRIGARHGLAAPSCGAFFRALHGANPGPHMLDAPA